MGSRKHLKRYKAPKSWPIHPKEDTWTVKPAPGSHAIDDSLPLLVIIRDILGLADNSREAKRIINTGNVLIDGRAVKDYKFPVGFMDVLTIPKTEENYRILLDTKGRLTLHPISAEDASYKLAKVVNKSTIKGGKTQLNLHDGRNVLVDEDVYAGQDVICIGIPEQEIKEKGDKLVFINEQNDNLDNMLNYSGLLMSGSNYVLKGRKLPEDIEDGILTAREISQVDLGKVGLVVLSACQTALGEIREDGVFGIQRGFKKAGAHSLLMSLWKVDDRATEIMMTAFYRNLVKSNDRYDAFKKAQKTVRERGFKSPYYWASFILLDGK